MFSERPFSPRFMSANSSMNASQFRQKSSGSVSASNCTEKDEIEEFKEQNQNLEELINEIHILRSDKSRLEQKLTEIEIMNKSNSYEKIEEMYKEKIAKYDHIYTQYELYQNKEKLALQDNAIIQAKYNKLKIEFEQKLLVIADYEKKLKQQSSNHAIEISALKYQLSEKDKKIEKITEENDETIFKFKHLDKGGSGYLESVRIVEFITKLNECKREYEMNLAIMEERWSRQIEESKSEIEHFQKRISSYKETIKNLRSSKCKLNLEFETVTSTKEELEEQMYEYRKIIESLRVDTVSFQNEILTYKRLLGRMKTKIEINKEWREQKEQKFDVTDSEQKEITFEQQTVSSAQHESDQQVFVQRPVKPVKPVKTTTR